MAFKMGPCKHMWVFPKIGVGPQNGWFIMENPIQMDDLGVPLFFETSMLVMDLLFGMKLVFISKYRLDLPSVTSEKLI